MSSRGEYRVFFTHGSGDKGFVERYLKPDIEETGARVFLDSAETEFGDDFREVIFSELRACDELFVYLTPTSIKRPWVFAEIGACLVRPDVRIVTLVNGPEPGEIQERGVLSLLGTTKLLETDQIEAYLKELKNRVSLRK